MDWEGRLSELWKVGTLDALQFRWIPASRMMPGRGQGKDGRLKMQSSRGWSQQLVTEDGMSP